MADLHNFGKSVQRIGQGAGAVYLKPRPIYWEWLFFGKNSPLSVFFNQSRIENFSPSSVLFNLVTEIESDFSGRSNEVVSSMQIETSATHFYSLGVLLAYCYIFGIRDLHKNNLVKTDTHLQVVDAEVVLSKLILPHETLLLPFKEVDSELCGASKVLDLSTAVAPDVISMIFSGYLDVFENVLQHQDKIQEIFNSLDNEMKQVPIRHILRDTFHYRDAKIKNPEIPFFEFEISQLQRGDIPYYFKFMGKPEVMELIDEDWSFQSIKMPDIFSKGAAREAQEAKNISNESRIRNQLLPSGLLYIAKELLHDKEPIEILGYGFEIKAAPATLTVNTIFGNFACERS